MIDFDDIWNYFCKFCLIVVSLLIINSLIGDFVFRVQYSFPKASQISKADINIQQDPIQKDINNSKYIKVYGDKNKYYLKPQAQYSLSGLVVAKNSNFWFRDVMRSTFDDICLIDFGIAWGDLASDKDKLYKYWKFKSKKTLGQSRQLEWRSKMPLNQTPWTMDYINSHISHTHMIPANANVMGGLLKIKKNDYVKLDGYLVDIYSEDFQIIAQTSLSRFDTNPTSRGYGACEDMYVKSVQIGNKIYR